MLGFFLQYLILDQMDCAVPSTPLVRFVGADGGLKLQLNIEQYEYMRGPNDGAGLKILIHNHNDVPMVRDHGLAVPPGSHGFVAIKTVEVWSLGIVLTNL